MDSMSPMHWISTHALRMEGDAFIAASDAVAAEFLPTPSAWRATYAQTSIQARAKISTHALRMEGDL